MEDVGAPEKGQARVQVEKTLSLGDTRDTVHFRQELRRPRHRLADVGRRHRDFGRVGLFLRVELILLLLILLLFGLASRFHDFKQWMILVYFRLFWLNCNRLLLLLLLCTASQQGRVKVTAA